MRITIDIDEEQLVRVQQATGIRKRSPAIRLAVDAFLQSLERQQFVRKVLEGRTDYTVSNDELEARGDYD
jgi:Arc/MetJ family transcription regulator